MTKGMIVSHSGLRCGVYQFGRNLFDMLSASSDIEWSYRECGDFADLKEATHPTEPDFIIFNHHPSTMPWIMDAPLSEIGAVKFALLHQVSQRIADDANPDPFDFFICLDPTIVPRNPRVLNAPRFLPSAPTKPPPPPDIFTVGSFGFATPGKGFERLCALVNAQFDRAVIRINIPAHDIAGISSAETVKNLSAACSAAIDKPGVRLDISHDFLPNEGIIGFLQANTVNAFLYEDNPSTGISSCADFALASGRPFALTRGGMFRNFFHLNPSVFVEDRTLLEIASDDGKMFDAARDDAVPAKVAARWCATILDALAARKASENTPDGRGFNKILDDRSRGAYRVALGDLKTLAPDMLARKIERANIQQAFGLDVAMGFLAENPNARIMAAGSYEDTAIAALRARGYRIDEIDPNVNGMTLLDYYMSPEARLGSYDLVLSVSVLEHVADDIQFTRILSEFLRPGGLAVLTVDFAENWTPGERKPEVDCRLYTTRDIRERLLPAIGDCRLVDPPRWAEGAEDFEYEGSQYGFAGLVFRKLDAESVQRAATPPVWRELLAQAKQSGNAGAALKQADKMTSIVDFRGLARFFKGK